MQMVLFDSLSIPKHSLDSLRLSGEGRIEQGTLQLAAG